MDRMGDTQIQATQKHFHAHPDTDTPMPSPASPTKHRRSRGIRATILLKSDQQAGRRRRGTRGRLPGFDAGLPPTQRRRASREQAPLHPCSRHQIRQARLHLPGHHRRRHNQDLATRPRPHTYAGHGLVHRRGSRHWLLGCRARAPSNSGKHRQGPRRSGLSDVVRHKVGASSVISE